MAKKVFVSGCYDLLHSGNVEFFKQAARYGDLHVGLGSDATILEYKHHKPMFPAMIQIACTWPETVGQPYPAFWHLW